MYNGNRVTHRAEHYRTVSLLKATSSMLPKSFVTQLPARFVNIKPEKLRTVKDT